MGDSNSNTAGDFDPYLKWLGIPPSEQPPNHYRLLGIELFTEDAEIIQNAADARMHFLRTFRTGKRVLFAERLQNEVSAAKIRLLDAKKKETYDAQLRQSLAPPPIELPAPAEPVANASSRPIPRAQPVIKKPSPRAALPGSPGMPLDELAIPEIHRAEPSRAKSQLKSKRSQPKVPAVAISFLAAALVAILGIGYFLVVKQPDESSTQPSMASRSSSGMKTLDRSINPNNYDNRVAVAPQPTPDRSAELPTMANEATTSATTNAKSVEQEEHVAAALPIGADPKPTSEFGTGSNRSSDPEETAEPHKATEREAKESAPGELTLWNLPKIPQIPIPLYHGNGSSDVVSQLIKLKELRTAGIVALELAGGAEAYAQGCQFLLTPKEAGFVSHWQVEYADEQKQISPVATLNLTKEGQLLFRWHPQADKTIANRLRNCRLIVKMDDQTLPIVIRKPEPAIPYPINMVINPSELVVYQIDDLPKQSKFISLEITKFTGPVPAKPKFSPSSTISLGEQVDITFEDSLLAFRVEFFRGRPNELKLIVHPMIRTIKGNKVTLLPIQRTSEVAANVAQAQQTLIAFRQRVEVASKLGKRQAEAAAAAYEQLQKATEMMTTFYSYYETLNYKTHLHYRILAGVEPSRTVVCDTAIQIPNPPVR